MWSCMNWVQQHSRFNSEMQWSRDATTAAVSPRSETRLIHTFLCSCRCIKTFEVEFSSDQQQFSRINDQDTIFTSYVYSPGKNSFKDRSVMAVSSRSELYLSSNPIKPCCVLQWTSRSAGCTESELWTTGDGPGPTRWRRDFQRITRPKSHVVVFHTV